MGKKSKNKNKVSGAVKTAAKTDKKLAQRLKKELATIGEEDISKVIEEIEREEAKRSAAIERTLTAPPSPRAYASFTPHPINNEVIMFGGEYHNGQKTEVYNDLLFYNPNNELWHQVKAPGAPPPRSAHQAVATPGNKGELWVFGGEFTSPTETQFHHYRDLWCFSLTDKKWEKVLAPGGPCARSGHRMVVLGRKLFVFGGYADDGRECRYFDDLYSFCLDTRTWTKLEPYGRGPCARSGCLLIPTSADSFIVYGGFSRIREGRTERTQTHGDMWRLLRRENASGSHNWIWRSIPNGGARAPQPRAGIAAAIGTNSQRAYIFGGVADVEETDEDLKGELSNNLQMLDVDQARWHQVTLRSEVQTTVPVQTPNEGEEQSVTVVTDDIFTMKLGRASSESNSELKISPVAQEAIGGPTPRMSAMVAVQRSVLYIYGGVLERDERQFYLSDMYSLDLHKLDKWRTLVKQPPLPNWLGSESESDDSESSDGSDKSDRESE